MVDSELCPRTCLGNLGGWNPFQVTDRTGQTVESEIGTPRRGRHRSEFPALACCRCTDPCSELFGVANPPGGFWMTCQQSDGICHAHRCQWNTASPQDCGVHRLHIARNTCSYHQYINQESVCVCVCVSVCNGCDVTSVTRTLGTSLLTVDIGKLYRAIAL